MIIESIKDTAIPFSVLCEDEATEQDGHESAGAGAGDLAGKEMRRNEPLGRRRASQSHSLHGCQ